MTPRLEAQADLLRRIDEAAKYVPLENLALSPQCGFASVLQGNMIEWDNQRRKLELLVDTARTVWARRPRTAHYTADLYSACQRGDIGVRVCMPLDAPSAIRRLGDEHTGPLDQRRITGRGCDDLAQHQMAVRPPSAATMAPVT